jgi:hypothetical protein
MARRGGTARTAAWVGVAVLAAVGLAVAFALLVSSRPDIGNPDLATVERTIAGRWASTAASREQFIAAFSDEWDAATLESFLDDLEVQTPLTVMLELDDGAMTISTRDAAGLVVVRDEGNYELRSNHTFVYTDGICDQSLEFRLTGDVLDVDVSAYSCVTEAQDLAIDVYFHLSAFSRVVAP